MPESWLRRRLFLFASLMTFFLFFLFCGATYLRFIHTYIHTCATYDLSFLSLLALPFFYYLAKL